VKFCPQEIIHKPILRLIPIVDSLILEYEVYEVTMCMWTFKVTASRFANENGIER